jgi:hypothetical protein
VGGRVTDHPQDVRVEAVDLVEPAALERLDLRPPFAGALGAWIEEKGAAGARYLGPLWVPESGPGRGKDG